MRILIAPDGTVTTPGVDMGGKMTLLSRSQDDEYLAMHVSGGTHWVGIGQPRSYHDARVYVYRRTDPAIYVQVLEWPARRRRTES